MQGNQSERCDRCGRVGEGDPCNACEQELNFWADVFREAGEE